MEVFVATTVFYGIMYFFYTRYQAAKKKKAKTGSGINKNEGSSSRR